jgi:hypothetical protein
MNEEALQDAYALFKSAGYSKSFDEYVTLINSNDDALNDSYNLFKSSGYGKSIDDFKTLVGVGQTEVAVEKMPEQAKTEPQKPGAAVEGVQAPDMESSSADGSWASPDVEKFAFSKGIEVPFSAGEYQELTDIDPNFDNQFGDYFLIKNPNTGQKQHLTSAEV